MFSFLIFFFSFLFICVGWVFTVLQKGGKDANNEKPYVLITGDTKEAIESAYQVNTMLIFCIKQVIIFVLVH